MARAFVYTELQNDVPFDEAPWRALNPVLVAQPGFLTKTWLSGVGNRSVGGFYEFATLADARAFVTGYFPGEAARFGVAQTTRIFDAGPVEEASRFLASVHFGSKVLQQPGAFVYSEVQISVDFAEAPWRQMNPILKAQPGLLHKTWLSGVRTRSVGGFYAFDTLANARRFATDYFPTEARALDVAYTTRLFDAAPVAEASRQTRSHFFG